MLAKNSENSHQTAQKANNIQRKNEKQPEIRLKSQGENQFRKSSDPLNCFFNSLLEETVVFIDEVDALVGSRRENETSKTIYVNTLLPHFQELHDNGKIILIMATNHLEKVDEAIARLGRIDLIIPVGAISSHARLKLFFKKFSECNLPQNNKTEALRQYLTQTQNMNFYNVKLYLDLLLSKLLSGQEQEINRQFLESNIADDRLDQIRRGNSLEKFAQKHRDGQYQVTSVSYDTRPKVEVGDFKDDGVSEQEKIIKLFLSIRNNQINQETVESLCQEKLYNMITPFYDDIANNADNADFVKAKKDLEELIEGRK